MEDNSHAGQGSVLLDIGGDIGALVVAMPEAMQGIEIEIRPVRDPVRGVTAASSDSHESEHDSHEHGSHKHDHVPHEHGHSHDGAQQLIHVAVVGRPAASGSVVYSVVFGELAEGTYELYERPSGPVRLTVSVQGGSVTEAVWPD